MLSVSYHVVSNRHWTLVPLWISITIYGYAFNINSPSIIVHYHNFIAVHLMLVPSLFPLPYMAMHSNLINNTLVSGKIRRQINMSSLVSLVMENQRTCLMLNNMVHLVILCQLNRLQFKIIPNECLMWTASRCPNSSLFRIYNYIK